MVLGGTAAVLASAQSFDTSANGTIKGDYFVRQILVSADQTTSAITRARSIAGVMTFDGNGKYSFTGQMMDSQSGSAAAYTVSGGYSAASNGLIQLTNPIDTSDTEYGGIGAIGPNAIVASATEGPYNDIFIAIPAGTGVSNSSIQGSYQAGFIDFLGGNASQVRDGYLTLTSNGSGSFGNVTVHGAMANQNNADTTQSLTGVTYSITGANGVGTLTFPTASTANTALLSGPKTMYVSADGNMIIGGAFSGFDLIVGLKSPSGVTQNTFSGTYFGAALENDTSQYCNEPNCIDSFYGSTNSTGSGVDISHLRLVGFNYNAYDYTTDGTYNFNSSGVYNSPSGVQFFLGANGQAVIQVGTGTTYTLTTLLHAKSYSGTGVFLNPLGITNAASFAPITNSVAPGEMVALFGSGMGPSTLVSAPSVPLTTGPLSGVQVKVNGVAAPLIYVRQDIIAVIVPWETPANSFATFQVFYNGTASNAVTVYTAATAPGVFTSTQNGIGPAIVTHTDYSLVTQSSPAKAGETLTVWLTGLGTVTNQGADGAPGSSTPPYSQVTDQNLYVEFLDSNGNFTPCAASGTQGCSITFAGLNAAYPGLYQINFTVPKGLASGVAYLDIGTTDAYTTEASINIQ
jgi:uncharacterized protein (TIGR03437 family)